MRHVRPKRQYCRRLAKKWHLNGQPAFIGSTKSIIATTLPVDYFLKFSSVDPPTLLLPEGRNHRFFNAQYLIQICLRSAGRWPRTIRPPPKQGVKGVWAELGPYWLQNPKPRK